MESANKVPFCLSGYDASDVPWVVPVPGLTGLAITSHRSHNLVKLISSPNLLARHAASSAGMCAGWYTSQRLMTAQTIRAVLLPIATVATRTGFRASRSANAGRPSGVVPGASDQRCCTDDEQPAQVLVAHLGDAPEPLLAAAGVLKRCQHEPGGELPTGSELARHRFAN